MPAHSCIELKGYARRYFSQPVPRMGSDCPFFSPQVVERVSDVSICFKCLAPSFTLRGRFAAGGLPGTLRSWVALSQGMFMHADGPGKNLL
jgi:hypothetical protein